MENENISQEEKDLILQDIDKLSWGTNQGEEETTTDKSEASQESSSEESSDKDGSEGEASSEEESKSDKVKKLLSQRNSEKREKEELADRVKQLENTISEQELNSFLNKYPAANKVLDAIDAKMEAIPWISREEAYVLVWWKMSNKWTNMGGVPANSVTDKIKQAEDMTMDELTMNAQAEIERELSANWVF